MKMPEEAAAAMVLLNLVPKGQWGARIADLIWLTKKSKSNQIMVGVIRASSSEESAAEMLRTFYTENFFTPMMEKLKVDNKEVRSVMLSSLMVGFTFNDKILSLFGHLKVDEKKTKKLMANAIQSILTSTI